MKQLDSTMQTMFRLTPEMMERAGIEIRKDDSGAVEIRGEIVPCQIFDSSFVSDFVHQVGSREADRILDIAGATVQREFFLYKFRQAIQDS